MVQKIKKQMDDIFGTPGQALKQIKELSDSVATIDMSKLKELRVILATIPSLQIDNEFLRLVVELVKILDNVELDKVKEFRQLILNISQLVAKLPKDIPIGEILQTVKEDLKSS